MLLNKSFYPTPKKLIAKMWSKIDHNDISNILEPSAGKGDILDYIKEQCSYRGAFHMSCIEKEIVKSFEGKDSYNKNIGMIEYVKNENIKMLE
jgi:hypothetical protein